MKAVMQLKGLQAGRFGALQRVYAGAQFLHRFGGKRLERLAHVAQLQRLLQVDQLVEAAALVPASEADHILQQKFVAEFAQLGSPAGAGLDQPHHFHAFDGFPQHVAADAKLLAQLLFCRQGIAGLQVLIDDVLPDLAESLQVQFFGAVGTVHTKSPVSRQSSRSGNFSGHIISEKNETVKYNAKIG